MAFGIKPIMKKYIIATLLLLVVTRKRKRGCDPMKEGDWVVCKYKTNRQGERVRGYIKRVSKPKYGANLVAVRPANYGICTLMYFDIKEVEFDDSRHPDDVQEMIDWALADNDKIYFKEISKREVVK
jgi:hypothetical protein